MRSSLAAIALIFCFACSSEPRKITDVRIDYSIDENGSGSPSYHLSIRGNGRVRYEGSHNIGVPGVQEYVIPQETVRAIIEALDDARFFSMPEKSSGIVFDCPVISIRYSDGRRKKLVIDNGWAAVTGHIGLWQLSRRIEQLSGAERLVHSNLSDYVLLVAQGWNVNTSAKWGWTALDHAVGHSDYLSAEFLIEHGATASQEAIVTAAVLHDEKCLKLLLRSRRFSQLELTRAATYAAGSHDPTALNLLLAAGANPNGDRAWGTTPLFEAVGNASGVAIDILVNHGADVNARDVQGNTPLIVAAVGYDSGIVRQLIELGAKIEAQDRNGKTALANAYDRCYYWTMIPLLQAGAVLKKVAPQPGSLPCVLNGDEKAQRAAKLLSMVMAKQRTKFVDKESW